MFLGKTPPDASLRSIRRRPRFPLQPMMPAPQLFSPRQTLTSFRSEELEEPIAGRRTSTWQVPSSRLALTSWESREPQEPQERTVGPWTSVSQMPSLRLTLSWERKEPQEPQEPAARRCTAKSQECHPTDHKAEVLEEFPDFEDMMAQE
jgi:hypothetical protein